MIEITFCHLVALGQVGSIPLVVSVHSLVSFELSSSLFCYYCCVHWSNVHSLCPSSSSSFSAISVVYTLQCQFSVSFELSSCPCYVVYTGLSFLCVLRTLDPSTALCCLYCLMYILCVHRALDHSTALCCVHCPMSILCVHRALDPSTALCCVHCPMSLLWCPSSSLASCPAISNVYTVHCPFYGIPRTLSSSFPLL